MINVAAIRMQQFGVQFYQASLTASDIDKLVRFEVLSYAEGAPVRGGKQPKIMFATQAGIRPPHFVLFTSGFLQAGYRRFIERRLREEFGFEGTPVHLSMRLREKRAATSGRGARSARSARHG